MNIKLENITVKFAHKTVLENLCVEFTEGQIHGLLGENGAGKSTTANLICGELKQNEGKILIDGKETTFHSPKDSINHGICYVHQRPMLADSLTLKENLLLGVKKVNKVSFENLVKKWLKDININAKLKDLGADTRFFTALCGAFLKNPKVLILDEPTALLDFNQRNYLFENLKQLAVEGLNIIVITHSLSEAQQYCNNVFFLEDGKIKEDFKLEEFVIRTRKSNNQEDKSQSSENISFSHKKIKFRNITCRPYNQTAIFDINFMLEQGKIALISGLPEDGILTLENLITGMYEGNKQGIITIEEEISDSNSKRQNIIFSCNLKSSRFDSRTLRNKLNLKTGIVPTDRKYRGSNPCLTIEKMLTAGNSKIKNTKSFASKIISISGINIKPEEKAGSLSGGMLQRLIYNREISCNPDLLILCQPLHGLDSNAAASTALNIRNAADKGSMVVILSSSDFPSDYCDKIYNLKNGHLKEAE